MRTPSFTTAAIGLACGLSTLPSVFAQTTSATSVSVTEESEIVNLSPFEVNTTKDVGYLAGNTLAGSRLNTSLKDTGAAISVLTPEFLKDIGATNMQDVILFSNNAVPDVGDAAFNVNGNPMIGNGEWQLRIRGMRASYARNFFKWDASTDFYNVDRIDQTRGPNSILFGFGAPGGLVNTSTKQAVLNANNYELSYTAGSWDRHRGTFDANIPLIRGELAMRVNAVAENGKSWREFEFDRSRRAHIATKWQPAENVSLRVEGEIGKVTDNVARPWLAIDQSFLWREAGRPTYSGQWPSGVGINNFWPDHRVMGDDGVVRNWIGRARGYNAGNASPAYRDIGAEDAAVAPTWAAWPDTAKGRAIIPRHANTGGPDAVRETKYKTVSAFFENKVTDAFFYELALNHQTTDFLGYDPDGSRATSYWGNATEIWGEASADLPDATGASAGPNPNAGRLYVENNWTRRNREIDTTEARLTAAYNFTTGDWGRHRAAGLLSYNIRTSKLVEETEAFYGPSGPTFDAKAEADVNRLYRRHYFDGGDARDIRVQSWRVAVPGTDWVTTQKPEDTEARLTTGMIALQSFFLDEKLVTIAGLRRDNMGYDFNIGNNDLDPRRDGQWFVNPIYNRSVDFNANTMSGGAVYHTTKWLSVYGNAASSRDLPEVRIQTLGRQIPPMPESKGADAGIKLDLMDGKLYATIGYYKAETEHMADWGNIQTGVTDRNLKILNALRNPDPTVSPTPLITDAEYESRLITANGFLFDRDSSGWEFTLVANPTKNWRVSANFSINNVIARNSMAEVKAWSDENVAYWRSKAPTTGQYAGDAFPTGDLSQISWDTLGNHIRWMEGYINSVVELDGNNARGQRKYGANLYTKYTFDSGPLKNLSIGGGGRYQSANVLGMYDNTLDMVRNTSVQYGKSLTLIDASIGYNFKTEFLSKGSWVDLQLNVSNVFDETDPQVYTLSWWADVSPTNQVSRRKERIGLQEPRKVTFTATLHF